VPNLRRLAHHHLRPRPLQTVLPPLVAPPARVLTHAARQSRSQSGNYSLARQTVANLTLQLESDALREAIAQSIIGQLTPEAQRELLDKAIQAVLATGADRYDRGRSPLQLAFENAVQRVAQEQAVRLVQEDESMKARLQQLLRNTADKVLAADTEKLSERMADAFVASMRRDY